MIYEVYVDSLIGSNTIMNCFALTLVGLWYRIRVPLRKRLLGSFLGTLPGALCFCLPIPQRVLQPLAGAAGMCLMIWVTFPVRSWRAFWETVKRCLLALALLGAIPYLLLRFIPALPAMMRTMPGVLGVESAVFGLVAWQIRRRQGKDQKTICRATLVNGRKTCTVHALIDSGNSLVEPVSGKPVCILEQSIWEELSGDSRSGYRAIPYHSIGKRRGILQGYLIGALSLETEGPTKCIRDVYVAGSDELPGRSKEGAVQLIINPKLFN